MVDPTAGARARRTPSDFRGQKRTKPARGGRPDEPANRDWWRASAEAAAGRLDAARRRWVAASDVAEAGRVLVAAVERHTRAWPAHLARVVGQASDPAALGGLDEPGQPGCLRPLFAGLAAALGRSPAPRAITALDAPAPIRLPPVPATTAGARAQYRRTAARLKRVDVERQRTPHLNRDLVADRLADATTRFRATWWSVWPPGAMRCAGDAAAARRLADETRASTLHELARAFGITYTPPRERPTRAASRRRK